MPKPRLGDWAIYWDGPFLIQENCGEGWAILATSVHKVETFRNHKGDLGVQIHYTKDGHSAAVECYMPIDVVLGKLKECLQPEQKLVDWSIDRDRGGGKEKE